MADEHHLGLLVVPREEQVQQDEEALGEVLARFVHGAGDVHQAEHHGLAGRLGLADAVAVAQVEGVQEGNALDALTQFRHPLAQHFHFRRRALGAALQVLELALGLLQFLARVAAHGDAARQAHAHGAHHVQAGRVAFGDEAGAAQLPFRHVGQQLRSDHARQGEIVEEVVHELFARDPEDEVVFALPILRGAAAARAAASAALRPLDAVAADVFLVAGMHQFAAAPRRVAEGGLRHVALRERDVGAFLEVGDAAVADGLAHGFLDLLAVAAQEPLAVADRLVLAREAAVDDLVEHGPLATASVGHRTALPLVVGLRSRFFRSFSARASTTRTAGAPACVCSPSRPCG